MPKQTTKTSKTNTSSKATKAGQKPRPAAAKPKTKRPAKVAKTTKTTPKTIAVTTAQSSPKHIVINSNVFQRKFATFQRLSTYGKAIAVCLAVAMCLSVPLILMALSGFVIFSLRSYRDNGYVPGIAYGLFLGTVLYLCVSLTAMYVLGRMAARSEGAKSYLIGGVAILMAVVQSYTLIWFLAGV